MDKKIFTAKQVYILVFVIVLGIAFLETGYPLWSEMFWREFILNVLIYGAVVEFVVILLAGYLDKN